MAGYSETPLATKLGIKPDSSVSLIKAPPLWTIPDLPDGVIVRNSLRQRADVTLAFFQRRADLNKQIGTLADFVFPDRSLWIAWPRKAAGHVSDIDENAIRYIALPTGLVDVKVAAIDEDWSGLKLVWRKELRK